MGTAATALSTLLGNRVNITTPKVALLDINALSNQHPLPFVAVDVKYKEGIEGLNVLILKEDDAKIITDLMMGGSGQISPEPLSELHLSAISEAMNQMVGSSSTSLSEMFSRKIDICPPRVFRLDFNSKDFTEVFPELTMKFIKISFRMEIGTLIDSEIMQLIPLDFAEEMVDKLMNAYGMPQQEVSKPAPVERPQPAPVQQPQSIQVEMPQQPIPQPQPQIQPQMQPQPQPQVVNPVNVQPLQFQSFDEPSNKGTPVNIDLIQDVPLNITVELGRTVKRISEILEFGPGTIVELDKLVGEPLDILVNGQYVAKGEVVVIDENFGVRVTDIISQSDRLRKLK